MQSHSQRRVRGWLFDVYPSVFGTMTVWIITESGQRVRLTDKFQPNIYISGKQGDIERLANDFCSNQTIASWNFVLKYANPTDFEKSRVLEVTLKDCRKISAFTNQILRLGDYLRYRVHNCDLQGDRMYLFSNDLFPLAYLEVESAELELKYQLLDSIERINYSIPHLRLMELGLNIAKENKIASLEDPIESLQVTQDGESIVIDDGAEEDKLLEFVKVVKELDPDIVLTRGGDSFIFSYLIQRANHKGILDKFLLGRDDTPFVPKPTVGRTFFSYGRTFYKAPTIRLFGRIHVDKNNTFILNESSFQGMFEIARTCRVPLHTAARSSIGSIMSSLEFYQAFKDDILLPRNKSIPEAFKSAYELLVADRGGFVYEPKVGIHDSIGEVDFSSMYPSLMVNNNISAETVLCECCPNSKLRIPELNYNICEKRQGVVPKAIQIILTKRQLYKRLKEETHSAELKEIYDNRQVALKWILVTCFGYLGYRNAKFGTIDGHIGVCAFGRDSFLRAARRAEEAGFEVVHGIVDSLWLKKENASAENYKRFCSHISDEIGVVLNFEGKYKWIVFLPSRMHPNVGVLNRYYGVMENGKVKARGLEVRKRDTPKFVYNAQMEMINVLAGADNSSEFMYKIPEVIDVVRKWRCKLLDGDVPVWDLIIKKHLSKDPKHYKQHVSQVIAAEQLIKEGSEIHAGNNVTFLFTGAKNKQYNRRVLASQFVDEDVNVDNKRYLILLYTAAANLLSFEGYTAKSVSELINGLSNSSITRYL